jgi:rod shape-determining protein MreD
VALIAIQVVVLNNVYLGGFVSPMIYLLAILMLPTRLNKNLTLVIAFAAGMTVDIFCNMLGFHACAATLVAFCRVVFADRIITRNETSPIMVPSIYAVSYQYFLYYAALLTFIYTFLYFTLQIFSFADMWQILLSSVLSTLVSLILYIVWQLLFLHKKQA